MKNKGSFKFDPSNSAHVKIGLGFCFALIIFFFIYGIVVFTNDNSYKNIKENTRLGLVYSTDNSTEDRNIPYINIKNFSTVNENINNFVNKYKDEEDIISYDYEVNGVILSLIISAIYEDEEVPSVSFLSYNINLEQGKVISDSRLIDYYGLNTDNIEEIVKDNFGEHYKKEIKKGYIIEEECNFDCYLGNRGEYHNYAYYISDGNLYAYVPFDIYSVYGEENYFKDEDFKMFLAEAPEE